MNPSSKHNQNPPPRRTLLSFIADNKLITAASLILGLSAAVLAHLEVFAPEVLPTPRPPKPGPILPDVPTTADPIATAIAKRAEAIDVLENLYSRAAAPALQVPQQFRTELDDIRDLRRKIDRLARDSDPNLGPVASEVSHAISDALEHMNSKVEYQVNQGFRGDRTLLLTHARQCSAANAALSSTFTIADLEQATDVLDDYLDEGVRWLQESETDRQVWDIYTNLVPRVRELAKEIESLAPGNPELWLTDEVAQIPEVRVANGVEFTHSFDGESSVRFQGLHALASDITQMRENGEWRATTFFVEAKFTGHGGATPVVRISEALLAGEEKTVAYEIGGGNGTLTLRAPAL